MKLAKQEQLAKFQPSLKTLVFSILGASIGTSLLQDTSRRLFLIFRKLDIQTFNFKQICSLGQYCQYAII